MAVPGQEGIKPVNLKEIELFISKQKVSFVCSVDQDGFPNVKAMLKPRKRNGMREFWFSMEVLTDQETKNMIWRKGDTVFYKKGVTDPDYCVLKFTAETGRWYCDMKTESFSVGS